MQPGTVRAEQQFARSGSFDRLYDVIETPYARRVRIDVGVTNKLIHDLLLRSPVICETAKVRDDEVHVRILRREQIHDIGVPDYIHKQGEAERPRYFADLSCRHGVVAVYLDPTKVPLSHGSFDHRVDAPGVPSSMDESEANQSGRVMGDDAG